MRFDEYAFRVAGMRSISMGLAVFTVGWMVHVSAAQEVVKEVRRAVEKSTLDQSGTKPFHLKATIGPLHSGGDDAKMGSVEIWWESPGRWRRELHSKEFNQVEVVNDAKDWQKNEGDFFPEWLREGAVAVVKPVPDLDHVLSQVKTAEVKVLFGETHISWVDMGTDGTVSKGIGAGLTLREDGSLDGGSGIGWSSYVERTSAGDFIDFHGRKVAHQVEAGAQLKVTLLEDLKETPAGFFEAPATGDAPIRTLVVDELTERKNLIPGPAPAWPTLDQGPLTGVTLSTVVIDRAGTVREVGTPVSDNPGLNGAAMDWIRGMRFRPMLLNGQPVQVVTTITLPFKTTRPAGMESFDSARNYMENGRKASLLAAGGTTPYLLQAEFTARDSSGAVEKGTYTDSWVSDLKWRREAVLGASRYVRARNGEHRYELAEGPDARLLRLIFVFVEPIPPIDTFVESDWRIKRDRADGVASIRLATGYESPDGVPDAEHFRGYWFDDQGHLLKSFENGLEVRRFDASDFGGMPVARQIEVYKGGKLAMQIVVTKLDPLTIVDDSTFVLKGHEYKRQFTAEVR